MTKHPCLVHFEIVHPMSDHFKSTEIARHPCLLIWGVWPFRHSLFTLLPRSVMTAPVTDGFASFIEMCVHHFTHNLLPSRTRTQCEQRVAPVWSGCSLVLNRTLFQTEVEQIKLCVLHSVDITLDPVESDGSLIFVDIGSFSQAAKQRRPLAFELIKTSGSKSK